ncbi:hypothetical protein EON83_04855 [bacterium]|nr:MAG: hypothetical protein EON83_04855 [bacterium]
MRCLNCQTDNIALSAHTCPSCGMNLHTIWGNALPMGTLINGGKYRIDWLLGRGGFGITYRATHTLLGRVVAIKEFFPRDFVHRNVGEAAVSVMPVSQNDYQRGLDRFLREGQVLSQIKEDHVVRVEDFFEDNGTAYLVMELLEGNSLRTELRNAGGRLPQARILDIIEDLVQALTVTHAQKVWHCDIKPDNIQILPSGRAVLIDFGAAHQGLASQSTRAFTRDYAAPELETGKAVDGRTDLFELGMMIHEMVTGRRPPMAVDRMMKDTWNSSHLRNPWKGWLPPLLQMRPEQRPDSVGAWWKKRPKSVPSQLPVSPSVPVNTAPSMSPAISPAVPTTPSPAWGSLPQTAISPPPPLRPAPRITPGGGSPAINTSPSPRRSNRPFTVRYRKPLIALGGLGLLMMMWLGIQSAQRPTYSYYPNNYDSSPTAAPVGPEQATKRLERVIREGQNEAAFRLYVGKGASLNKADYRDGQGNALTPLLFAIKKYGDSGIIRTLADKGARINTKNGAGETPLHYAARLGRVEAGQALMEAGAQINAKDENGWTPLHVSAKYGQQSMADLLLSNRANVNAKSNYGGTPLHVASFYGQTDVAELLISKGADVSAKDSDGGTPLHIAAHYGKEPIAVLLLKKQAKINEQRDSGDTPLHVAIREGKFDIVRLLLSEGADVNIRNKEGETALFDIVRTGQRGLTEQIIDRRSDVNLTNENGETPLHIAARRDNVGVATVLLDKGANVNAASNSGETPLHVAAETGQVEMAQLLLSRRADVNLVDKSGQTAQQKAKGRTMFNLLTPSAETPEETPTEEPSGIFPGF